jgi:1,4-dihydroxy-2-naphthoate octaprenyltransferase
MLVIQTTEVNIYQRVRAAAVLALGILVLPLLELTPIDPLSTFHLTWIVTCILVAIMYSYLSAPSSRVGYGEVSTKQVSAAGMTTMMATLDDSSDVSFVLIRKFFLSCSMYIVAHITTL